MTTRKGTNYPHSYTPMIPQSPPTPEIDILDDILYFQSSPGSSNMLSDSQVAGAKAAILKDFIPKSKVRELLKDEEPDWEEYGIVNVNAAQYRNQLRSELRSELGL